MKIGLLFEREQLHEPDVDVLECRSLRHLFGAQRAASKIPDVPEDRTHPAQHQATVGVIGAGTMGGGIAMNFLNAGIAVKMIEIKQEALDRGTNVMRKNYEAQVKKGKLKQDKLRAAHGPAQHHAELRRSYRCRPGD